MSYTPEQSAPGMLEEPEPVKLALMKRTSQGGSQRLAVRRVGSVSQRGGGDTNANQRASVVNPYFSSPMSAGAPPFQRPALVRTPSSDTLPHSNGDFPSPLALNPPLGASTGPRVPAFTWGSWGPDAPVRASLLPDQYQNLNAQLQSDYPYTYRAPISQPHYSQERNQDHISLRLQRDDVSPRSAQEPSYNAESSHRSNTGARFTESGYLPPNPLNPKNNRAISPVSPYSSTFENPLASPSFMSPLSPPPKSPLRTVVRPSRSDYSLRERSVSPLSSDGGDSTDKPMPPLPLRRLSRSSGALGALNFAQATAGLDLSAGPGGALFTPTPPFLTCTDTNGTTFSGVVSRASSLRSSNTNTNPDGGGQFTFLASNGHTPESNRSVTPTSPWGPLPALKKRRSSSLGRIEILPEELTTGGIYVGAPGPRFTLFPRTDGGNESSIAAIAPMSPLGMGHSRSHSTGNVGLGVVDR